MDTKSKRVSDWSRLVPILLLLSFLGMLSIATWRIVVQSSDPHLMHTFIIDQPARLALFSPDERYVAAAGNRTRALPAQVSIWHTDTQQLLTTQPQDRNVTAMAFHPNSQRLFVVTGGKAIMDWDVRTQHMTQMVFASSTMTAPLDNPCPEGASAVGQTMTSIAVHPHGDTLAIGCSQGALFLIHVDTGEIIYQRQSRFHDQDSLYAIRAMAFSPDGTLLASANDLGAPHVWQVQDGRLVQRLDAQTSGIAHGPVRFQPDGQALVVANGNGTADVWSLVDTQHLLRSGPSVDYQLLALSRDGTTVAARRRETHGITLAQNRNIFVFSLPSTEQRAPLAVLHGHRDLVLSVDFSRTGNQLVSGSRDGTVRLWLVDKALNSR